MKRYLAANGMTMIMALFLAVLTWIYLFTQGNGPAEIDIVFTPRLDLQEFASVSWKDGDNQPLARDGTMRIRVVGPKTDVATLRLRPRVFACDFLVDPKDVTGKTGDLTRVLTREDFNLPSNIVIDPLPKLTLTYAKYEERKIELTAGPETCEGSPRPGFLVESVTPNPRVIRARVPADQPEVKSVAVRPIPVQDKYESFSLTPWLLSPEAEKLIRPLEPFTVEVKIAPKPFRKTLSLDLSVAAKPEHLKRIELQTRTVQIELSGPQDAVEQAAQDFASFVPYVVVTDKDMDPGPKNIGELGCHIQDPKYQGTISVVVMSDQKPENRQVKITVLPGR